MLVQKGQNQSVEKSKGSFNALRIMAVLFANAANQKIQNSDFDPSQVNVKVVLTRDKQITEIYNGDLYTLGIKNSLKKGLHEFINGVDVVHHAQNIEAQKLRFVDLRFDGCLNLLAGDSLKATVTLSKKDTFGTLVADDSYIDFEFVEAIGYEMYLPSTKIISITEGQEKQSFDLGDNIKSIMLINFDKSNYAEQVVDNLTLTSDRLDFDYNFNQLLAHHTLQFDNTKPSRFGTSLPVSDNDPTIQEGLPFFPQTLILFDGKKHDQELDDCSLSIKFNLDNLNKSQNFLVVTSYTTSIEQLRRFGKKREKHKAEKFAKIA